MLKKVAGEIPEGPLLWLPVNVVSGSGECVRLFELSVSDLRCASVNASCQSDEV